jgi:prepilin-type processing-associated H-X9-DG protein
MIAMGDSPEVKGQDGDIAGALDDPADFVADRHNQGANILFCDGHVEYDKQTNWMKPIEITRQRWNYDHQPHIQTWH